MKIDDRETVREVEAAFALYEAALVSNDIGTLDALFWPDERVVRYGAAEALYGITAIRDFRRNRPGSGLDRSLRRTVITTFGRDFATASTLFWRPATPDRVGRQQQSWVRMEDGWRIVAAHVSMIADDTPAP